MFDVELSSESLVELPRQLCVIVNYFFVDIEVLLLWKHKIYLIKLLFI